MQSGGGQDALVPLLLQGGHQAKLQAAPGTTSFKGGSEPGESRLFTILITNKLKVTFYVYVYCFPCPFFIFCAVGLQKLIFTFSFMIVRSPLGISSDGPPFMFMFAAFLALHIIFYAQTDAAFDI